MGNAFLVNQFIFILKVRKHLSVMVLDLHQLRELIMDLADEVGDEGPIQDHALAAVPVHLLVSAVSDATAVILMIDQREAILREEAIQGVKAAVAVEVHHIQELITMQKLNLLSIIMLHLKRVLKKSMVIMISILMEISLIAHQKK